MHLDPGTAHPPRLLLLAASTIIPRASINKLRGAGSAEKGRGIEGEGKEALRTDHRGEDRLPDASATRPMVQVLAFRFRA